MQRHLDVWALYINPTVRGRVVDPLEVVGTLIALFSVFVHPIVCAAALKSYIRTIVIWPSTAPVTAIVIAIVAAELFVKVFNLTETGTVPALDVTVTALFA